MTTKALIRFATPGSNPEHGDWQLVDWPPVGALPTGFIQGLVPRNPSGGGSDPTNDITFGAGKCRDAGDGADLVNPTDFTKRADAAWAAGTGNGGMASGVSWGANSFHLHALGKSTDADAIDFIFDTSVTAANALADSNVIAAGFDLYRRVGSLKTAGAAWPTFTAVKAGGGALRIQVAPAVDFSKDWTGADDTAQTGTSTRIPSGVQMFGDWSFWFSAPTGGGTSGFNVSSFDVADTAPIAGAVSGVTTMLDIELNNNAAIQNSRIEVMTRASDAAVRYRGISTTANHSLTATLRGWTDFREV